MRKMGQHFDAEAYDPSFHEVPNNRATRRAIAAVAKRRARQAARKEAAEKAQADRVAAKELGGK